MTRSDSSQRAVVLLALQGALLAGAVHALLVAALNPVLFHPQLRSGAAVVAAFLVALWLMAAVAAVALLRWRPLRRRYAQRSPAGFVAGLLAWIWLMSVGGSFLSAPVVAALVERMVGHWTPAVWGLLGALALALAWGTGALVQGLAVGAAQRPWWRRIPAIAAGVVLAAVVALVVLASGGEPGGAPPAAAGTGEPPRRVVVMGIDGADWRTIDELIAAGRLPHFARLRAEARTAPLATIGFPSPVIWTSVATGAPPERHGVTGLLELYFPRLDARVPWLVPNPLELLPERWLTRQKAPYDAWLAWPIWELADRYGRTSLVVNWLYTVPPVPLEHGTLVPDDGRLFRDLCRRQSQDPAVDGLRARLEQSPAQLGCPAETADGGLVGYGGPAVHAFGTGVPERVRWRVFRRLLDTLQPQLSAYYTPDVDRAGHDWRRHWLALPESARTVGPERLPEWRDVVRAYDRVDRALGELMVAATTDTALLVLSDHGWEYNELGHELFPPGVFALWTPDRTAAGPLDVPVSIYDIAPIVARLSGLPLSASWAQRSAANAVLAPLALPRPPVVAGFGPRAVAPTTPRTAGNDDAYVDALRSLGYVQ